MATVHLPHLNAQMYSYDRATAVMNAGYCKGTFHDHMNTARDTVQSRASDEQLKVIAYCKPVEKLNRRSPKIRS